MDSLPDRDPGPPRAAPVAVVVKGWPRLSETFIAQELAGLEARGLDLRVYSLRYPTDRKVHAINQAVRAPVTYLPEYLWHAPVRVLRGWRTARRLPGYPAACALWLRDLRRDLTPNRIRRFGQALVLAAEMPPEIAHLYAHFIHTPASVARYAAVMRGLGWSASAHAKDIWTTPDWEKAEKLATAAWTVTCTSAGAAHLQALAPQAHVKLVHHGVDAGRFPQFPKSYAQRDGSSAADPVSILSVGRAVPKKGYEVLLAALVALPRHLHWRFIHIGGGPELSALKTQAASLGIADRIDWRGSRTESDVLAACRAADLFALASRVMSDGDRDGIPNVIAEAMSQGLPVVAADVGGVAELAQHDVTGLLVPAGDAPALAAALAALIADPQRRAALGAAGAQCIASVFAASPGYDKIAALLTEFRRHARRFLRAAEAARSSDPVGRPPRRAAGARRPARRRT